MLRCHRRQASVTSPLVKKDLRHHAFVLMAQQMTVKEGHAANDRIGEIHDQVHRAFGRHVYSVEPFWLRFWLDRWWSRTGNGPGECEMDEPHASCSQFASVDT